MKTTNKKGEQFRRVERDHFSFFFFVVSSVDFLSVSSYHRND